ncbi:universal stress protein [Draconibacterium sp. IB214405]|uniref:universal stress protein n=1 Tax=Draconibacterium sp. IB214405 TaxID=3097352 RepID=UPI002A16BB72|nr:universal stress protein [Draconibacterium sp. IB214405]MDX8339061.1 universal stress protein [Draconibacterium sp. IB214405]
MKVLSKVLWAIDFNSDHEISIEKLNRVRNQFGNDLVILHVLPSHIKGAASQKKITKSVEYEIRNKISARLNPENDQTISVRVEVGDIANQINKVAKEEKVNLIVLNKGRTTKLGANGFKILRKLQKPVAVLPQSPSGNKKHIVCAVDNSRASTLALKSAILHTRKIDAKLSIITVYRPFNLASPRLLRAGISEENERKRDYKIFKKEFRAFLKGFDFSHVDGEAFILEGNPETEVVKFSQEATILYVGSTGKSALQRAILGSVSEKVIREVGCIVVNVKTEDLFKLRFLIGSENVETHYNRGNELVKLGFLKEAIVQYKHALTIKNFHLPSIEALVKVYFQLGKKEEARFYENLKETIATNIMNRKIEHEIRKIYITAT